MREIAVISVRTTKISSEVAAVPSLPGTYAALVDTALVFLMMTLVVVAFSDLVTRTLRFRRAQRRRRLASAPVSRPLRRTDLGKHIPIIEVRRRGWLFADFNAVVDEQPVRLFRRFIGWPSRRSSWKARDLGRRIGHLLEDNYQRGLWQGMHPDDKVAEPVIHRHGDAPVYLHLYPFQLRRRGKTHWLLVYGSWVAHLRQRKTGVELEVEGHPERTT